MRTLKLTIAYDGTDYAGWQSQRSDLPTVQETLEAALEKSPAGTSPRWPAAGPTRAFMPWARSSAFQTDSALPPEVFLRALNANLPHDIAVLDAAEAPEGFHPIAHAVRKRYRYVIFDGPVRDVFLRHYVWHYAFGRLDAEAMHRAAAALLGKHDFRSFESSGAEARTQCADDFRHPRPAGAGQGRGRGLSAIFAQQKWDCPPPRLLGIGGGGRGTGDRRLETVKTQPASIPTTSSSSRSRPTGFSTTWSVPLSARWSKSAAAAGRKLARRSPRRPQPPRRRPHRPARGTFLGQCRVLRGEGRRERREGRGEGGEKRGENSNSRLRCRTKRPYLALRTPYLVLRTWYSVLSPLLSPLCATSAFAHRKRAAQRPPRPRAPALPARAPHECRRPTLRCVGHNSPARWSSR